MGKKYMTINPIVKRFFSYSRSYVRQFGYAIIGMVLVASCTSASAYLVKPILDDIFIRKDTFMLSLLPFAIIVVYFGKGAGRYIQTYYTNFIGQDIIRTLREQLLGNILHLDIDFFHKNRTGELISRITNDMGRIQSVVANVIPEMGREILTILSLLGVVIYQSPKLAFYFLIIMPLAIMPLRHLARKMRRISRSSQEKISDLTSRLTEIFNNVEMIKSSHAEAHELKRFSDENRQFFNLTMKSVRTSELVNPLMESIGALSIAIVIFVGGTEVIDGHMSVGSFFSFMTALFMIYTPIKRISSLYNILQDSIAAGERIFEYLDKRPTILSGTQTIPHILTLQLDQVTLDYGDKQALRGITLHAKRGETIALVGDSGGGKTSLINLLIRFYDPKSGELRLNETPLSSFSLASLRQNFALVSQRIFIFNDTVAANVAYGLPVDKEKVQKVLEEANAWDFVSTLPQGVDTVIDEFGTNLSGGQRQRIAIARALYKNPQVLILDEATSALDTTSERLIQEAIERASHDKITFVIAHRLSTVVNADCICLLKGGIIVAKGSHDELVASSPDYQKLLAKGL